MKDIIIIGPSFVLEIYLYVKYLQRDVLYHVVYARVDAEEEA